MSKLEEVLAGCTWSEGGRIGTVQVYSPMFEKRVTVTFFADAQGPVGVIDATMKEALADFLALDASQLPRLAELLFADCKDRFESVSFGVDLLEGEDETQANHRKFGVLTPADALAKSELKYVHIEGEKFPNRYFSIVFEAPWGDLEHMVYRNGRPLAFYEDGVYFGQFEQGPLAIPEP